MSKPRFFKINRTDITKFPFKQRSGQIGTHMLHVGNIYLHFPLNVAIFHLM